MDERCHYVTLLDVIKEDVHLDSNQHKQPEAAAGVWK